MANPEPQFEGEFEVHLTVVVRDESERQRVCAAASAESLKYSEIELTRGAHALQPMLTRESRSTLSAERAIVSDLCATLDSQGITVTRVKLEVSPWNADVPETDDQMRSHQPGRYFEHHLKLELAPGTSPAEVEAVVSPFGGHVSRNARRVRTDGWQERFVTQRFFDRGFAAAGVELDRLRAAIEAAGLRVLEQEREFVVFDSNLDLDEGWSA